MAKAKITIVGLGLVGSSIGMALRRGERDFEVTGHDRDPKVAAAAHKAGAVDRTEWNLIHACENASLIILALPMMAIRETMEAIASYLKPGCVVTDTASIKVPVLQWAQEILPDTVHFVGGNPVMNSPEGLTGVEAASADLLRGAIYCLCPTSTTAPAAVRVAADLVSRLEAQPLFLDAGEHDGLAAGVDHLPAVLAAVLLETTALTAPWREMRKLAGGQYQAVTHFVSGDPATYCDAILANRENVVRWIDTFIANLQQWRQRVADGRGDVLAESFQRAFEARDQWQREKAEGRWDERERISMEEIGGGWRGLLGIRGRSHQPERTGSKRGESDR